MAALTLQATPSAPEHHAIAGESSLLYLHQQNANDSGSARTGWYPPYLQTVSWL